MKTKLNNWYDPDTEPNASVITFNARVLKLHTKLIESNLAETPWSFKELALAKDILRELLTASGDVEHTQRQDEALVSFLSGYTNKTLTIKDLTQLCTIFIGWLPEFKEGIPYKQWNGTSPVWAVLYIETVKHSVSDNSKFTMECKCIQGPACGFRVSKRFTYQTSRMLYKDLCGYRYNEDDVTPSPLFLGGMYVNALVESTEKYVKVSNAFCTSTQKNFNKKLMGRRSSMCLGGFNKEHGKCLPYCPVSRDNCLLACHADTYIIGNCKGTLPRHKGYIMSHGWCSRCLREGYAVNDKFLKEETITS